MTITVAPSIPSPTSPASLPGTGGSEVTLEAGTFAAFLLSQMQTGNSELPLTSSLSSLKPVAPSEDKKDTTEESEELVGVSDPSVLALLAGSMPSVQPTHISEPKLSGELTEKALPGLPSALGSTDQIINDKISSEAETTPFDLNLVTKGKASSEASADFAAPPSTSEFSTNLANSTLPLTTQLPKEKATEISSPIHSEKWPTQFGEKLVWLAKNEVQTAQISINPPQLGPIQINLTLNGDQATAVFASPHAEVRHAIEDAMPQLKEMLSSAGINLGQSDVGSNMAQQQTFTNTPQNSRGPKNTDENAILPGNNLMSDISPSTLIRRGNGMVDLFA